MLKQFSIVLGICLLAITNGVVGSILKTPTALVVFDPIFDNLEDLSSVDSNILGMIKHLKEKYEVQFKPYSDEDLSLFEEGDRKFEHLVLLPPSKKAIVSKKTFNQHQLLEFINNEGNIFVVGDSRSALPEEIRSFLNELGIYPSPKNFKLIDHFNTVNGKVQLTEKNVENSRILKSLNVEYDGSAALISNNEMLFPIIRSSKTAFSSDAQEVISQQSTWSFGEQGFMAVGMQALNNARLVWVGSPSLVCNDLLDWTFQEKNVLKLKFVQHFKSEVPEIVNPSLYRITDPVTYTIGVSELVNGSWVPFTVKDIEDTLQLSFKMLDPYQRLNLQPLGPVASTEGSNELDAYAYFVQFKIPDHHGMFTFELDFKRHGLSYILDKKVVPVRHLANDEYKRSWDIPNSWLYVASAVLVVLSWLAFIVNYIYIGNVNYKKKNI
ncbi:uncharacterized protein PRCAT00002561001 [Priceomyces carsonii]|uniref:uncharacterized protein n=1 Tax=Priceomyces carsonii TaxID=28549 RepID=UPI002ED7C3C8|nr:unnamed protein product [Priceomyces carsonii]